MQARKIRWLAAAVPPFLALLCLSGNPQDPKPRQDGLPDLVGALKTTKGCLGVETARTSSQKQVIFAWFENKEAVLRWYRSPTHRRVMRQFIKPKDYKKPLAYIDDKTGPIMVVASLTMAKKSHFKELALPVSQIAIGVFAYLATQSSGTRHSSGGGGSGTQPNFSWKSLIYG